jgi:hypothetical protein
VEFIEAVTGHLPDLSTGEEEKKARHNLPVKIKLDEYVSW